MSRNKIESLVLMGFILSFFAFLIWANDQNVENVQDLVNWFAIALGLILARLFIPGIYNVIKNPQSPWRYHLKTKLFWSMVGIFVVFFIVHEFEESIANYYNLVEPLSHEEYFGVFNYVMPAFISAIIIITVAYDNKFSNYRRDFMKSIKSLGKSSFKLDKIKKKSDSESEGIFVFQNYVADNTDDYWQEMRRASKFIIGLSSFFIIFGIFLFVRMNFLEAESVTEYVSLLIDIGFAGSMFLIYWAYLHGLTQWHEAILFWVNKMDSKFEVDVDELISKVNSKKESKSLVS